MDVAEPYYQGGLLIGVTSVTPQTGKTYAVEIITRFLANQIRQGRLVDLPIVHDETSQRLRERYRSVTGQSVGHSETEKLQVSHDLGTFALELGEQEPEWELDLAKENPDAYVIVSGIRSPAGIDALHRMDGLSIRIRTTKAAADGREVGNRNQQRESQLAHYDEADRFALTVWNHFDESFEVNLVDALYHALEQLSLHGNFKTLPRRAFGDEHRSYRMVVNLPGATRGTSWRTRVAECLEEALSQATEERVHVTDADLGDRNVVREMLDAPKRWQGVRLVIGTFAIHELAQIQSKRSATVLHVEPRDLDSEASFIPCDAAVQLGFQDGSMDYVEFSVFITRLIRRDLGIHRRALVESAHGRVGGTIALAPNGSIVI